MMKHAFIALSTGFALFSMFFGSGNLVFPIAVGQESEGHTFAASFGIFLSGVFVPFLGVFGMMLYRGDFSAFFSCLGKNGTFLFTLFALAILGPFGVLARCLTVAHGALQLMLPGVPQTACSLVLCAVIYLLTVNKKRIVAIVGPIMTPFLLCSIGVIAILGLMEIAASEPVIPGRVQAFTNGFFQGYHTMDLLAAFFFSSFIWNHLQKKTGTDFSISLFVQSSFVGAAILSAVYVALVILGWAYAPEIEGIPPQEMLATIAFAVLGKYAAPCVCVAVILACLTTAIILTTLFADFLRQEVAKEEISNSLSLGITLGIGFLVSTLDFGGITRFLGPILETVYPALIVLTLVNIIHKIWGLKSSHWPATMTLMAKLLWV